MRNVYNGTENIANAKSLLLLYSNICMGITCSTTPVFTLGLALQGRVPWLLNEWPTLPIPTPYSSF